MLFLKLLLANGVIGISATILLIAFAHPLLSVFGRPQESELFLFRLLALSVGIRCFSFGLSTYVRSHRAFYPLLLCEAFAVSVLMVALSVGWAVDLSDVGWATVISALGATVAYGVATAVLWNRRCSHGVK
jgi:O-antigen/teichoic acid export membrane protein